MAKDNLIPIKVKGIFTCEEELFISQEDFHKLSSGDLETVKQTQFLIGCQAQERIQYGDTPFEIIETPISALKGTEPEETKE